VSNRKRRKTKVVDLPRFRGGLRAWDQGIWSDVMLSSLLVAGNTGIIPTLKISDSSLRRGEADEAIQNPRCGLWIASLRSQ
jgi:hypothetical protein